MLSSWADGEATTLKLLLFSLLLLFHSVLAAPTYVNKRQQETWDENQKKSMAPHVWIPIAVVVIFILLIATVYLNRHTAIRNRGQRLNPRITAGQSHHTRTQAATPATRETRQPRRTATQDSRTSSHSLPLYRKIPGQEERVLDSGPPPDTEDEPLLGSGHEAVGSSSGHTLDAPAYHDSHTSSQSTVSDGGPRIVSEAGGDVPPYFEVISTDGLDNGTLRSHESALNTSAVSSTQTSDRSSHAPS